MTTKLLFLIGFISLSAGALAQQLDLAGRTIRPSLRRCSEIPADGPVTLRLSVPPPNEVGLRNAAGGWAVWPEGDGLAMTKDEEGVWPLAKAALKPQLHTHPFLVDGLQAFDPGKTLICRTNSAAHDRH